MQWVSSIRKWSVVGTLVAVLLPSAQAAPEVVMDVLGRSVLGRSVQVDLPAKRVLLGFYIEHYFAVGGDKAFDRLVGLLLGWFVKSRGAVWEQYVAARPTLRDVIDVGSFQDQSFMLEKVLAAKPDVLVLADQQFKALASEMHRLDAAGIPVVVVGYNAQTLERHLASTRVLGQLRRIVFQGVHMLMGAEQWAPWREGEPRELRWVFIGRDMPKDILRQGLAQTVEPTRIAQ